MPVSALWFCLYPGLTWPWAGNLLPPRHVLTQLLHDTQAKHKNGVSGWRLRPGCDAALTMSIPMQEAGPHRADSVRGYRGLRVLSKGTPAHTSTCHPCHQQQSNPWRSPIWSEPEVQMCWLSMFTAESADSISHRVVAVSVEPKGAGDRIRVSCKASTLPTVLWLFPDLILQSELRGVLATG